MWDIFEKCNEDLRDFLFFFSQRKLLIVQVGEQTPDCDAPTVVELLVCLSVCQHYLGAVAWNSMSLHGVHWGTVGCYANGRVLRSQLADGVEFVIRFLIACDEVEENCSEVFLGIFLSSYPQWQADIDSSCIGSLS